MTPRILRFLVSGGSAAGVEYLVFLALLGWLGTGCLLLSQSLSFGCGFLVSFLLNRAWVFQSSGGMRGELVKYSAVATINLILGNLAIALMVTGLGLNALIAKFIVMAMVAAWNYIIFSRVVFRQPDSRQAPWP